MAGSSFDSENGFSEINITPFVDVVLVLLVIFMVAAPAMVKNVLEVKLPKASTGENKSIQTLGIGILANGQILLNGKLVTDEQLIEAATQVKKEKEKAQALIAADLKAEHGSVIKVIDLLKSAGVDDFAFQVEKPKAE
ncbi:MAG: ExbD/TolR family protein [Bacteriovoracaceae bacterium]